MTSDGGDPLPLTYGDFDATAPRWSHDGGRIAYISNEGGNTSLWVIELPGGRREQVAIRERRYREPMARLALKIVDERGRPVPARVSVTGRDGRSWAPDDAWRHADEAFDRSERAFEYGYFHAAGRAALMVPAGRVTVEVTRGPEYRIARAELTLATGGSSAQRVVLRRIADLPARGWWSGDVHVHMNYGGAYRNTPRHLAFQARAEDLHVVEDLVVNKEQRIPDIGYFRTDPDPASVPGLLLMHGQEFHTSVWGHLGLLGLSDHYLLPEYVGYPNTAAASLFPTNAAVADLAHAQGALVGYVHPFDARPDPADTTGPFTYELPVDVALVEFALAGREPGGEIELPASGGRLIARVGLRSNVPVDHLEIVGNGKVVATIPLSGDRRTARDTVGIPVATSGWYVLRAWSERAQTPVLDLYPFASTSPIYVRVGAQPTRSPEDAAFFVRWIDRLLDAARRHVDWNTPAERNATLRLFEDARAVYARLAGEVL